MSLYQKISILGPSAQYDTCGPKDFGQTTHIPGVYYAKLAGNRVCRLFKVLQTNYCQNHCRYCAFQRQRNCQRTSVSPEEMAQAFTSAWQRRLVDGLFLSSGIVNNAEITMTRMLDTVTILRQKENYQGYLHLKIMPGASASCISQAAKLANRISLNIEVPTEEDLKCLSPDKDLKKGFFYTLSLIKSELQKRFFRGQRNPSLTTQFVVGAAQETDKEIIQKTHLLYKNFRLARVFYSAFRPVLDTPLQDQPAESLTREYRLYQADFLLRFYQFQPWEIPLDSQGFLAEHQDPKMIWAQNHPELYPINLNQASYPQLLKVPGVGPTLAQKIVNLRRQKKIRSWQQLSGQRFLLTKMADFVCF